MIVLPLPESSFIRIMVASGRCARKRDDQLNQWIIGLGTGRSKGWAQGTHSLCSFILAHNCEAGQNAQLLGELMMSIIRQIFDAMTRNAHLGAFLFFGGVLGMVSAHAFQGVALDSGMATIVGAAFTALAAIFGAFWVANHQEREFRRAYATMLLGEIQQVHRLDIELKDIYFDDITSISEVYDIQQFHQRIIENISALNALRPLDPRMGYFLAARLGEVMEGLRKVEYSLRVEGSIPINYGHFVGAHMELDFAINKLMDHLWHHVDLERIRNLSTAR
ncbi:hypothetical protein [Telmatospirillum sp. J64-1]|uniref:hypothetical protein n=1 Tax=Telmatospirillum sp. J64-1 TaxID=2502183 RepID=UPI00115EE158|nr:hypothetical protein [Telmatospirillum sp. J64-1]